jgi:hypothetical protein
VRKYEKYKNELNHIFMNSNRKHSLTVPSTFEKIRKKSLTKLQQRRHQMLLQTHYDHIHFIRHYALNIFIYSILISASVFKSTYNSLDKFNHDFNSFRFLNQIQPISSSLFQGKHPQQIITQTSSMNLKISNDSLLLDLNLFMNIDNNNSTMKNTKSKLNKQILNEDRNTSNNKNSSLYTIKSLFDLIKNNRQHKEGASKFLNEYVYYSNILAHSAKLIIYVMFSANLNIYFNFGNKN